MADLRGRAVIVYCTWNNYLTNALTVIYCLATVEDRTRRLRLRACVNILTAISLYSDSRAFIPAFLAYDTYLLFRGGDLLEAEKINLLNCKTGNHLVQLVTIKAVSFDHVMWKCVSPEESTAASSQSRNYYTELQAFPSLSLSIFSYKAAVNWHSWNHFPILERGGPFPKYTSFSPGNVQHAFSSYFLVVLVLF